MEFTRSSGFVGPLHVFARTPRGCQKVVRNVDLVGLYPVPGVFALILPATNANQSAVVTGRILEAFRRGPGASTSRFAHITLRFGVAGMSKEHPKTASQLMDEAERFEIGQMT